MRRDSAEGLLEDIGRIRLVQIRASAPAMNERAIQMHKVLPGLVVLRFHFGKQA